MQQSVKAADSAWGEHARRLAFLRRVELFRETPDSVLANVATALRLVELPPGADAVRMGDQGSDFFLIESGTLSVLTRAGSRDREINRMGPGEFFGELALVHSTPRTATVRAVTAARLWTMSAADLAELRTRDRALDAAILAAASERAGRVAPDEQVEARDLLALLEGRKSVRIGRADDNEVVVDSALASAHHAVIKRRGEQFKLVDLGSTNGTFVNGVLVSEAVLSDGDEVWIGDQRFVFGSREIQRVVEGRGWRCDVVHLTKEVPGGKKLLQDISLSLLPGELVAVVGGSGSGKTTLLDAVAGVRAASAGRVLYNGRDRYAEHAVLRTSFGYVPQDDVLHPQLSVRRTLEHTAKLRLPLDMSAADRAAAVEKALGQLALTEQAELPVARLSGGQRKRVSIGLELLTPLRLFFLDEPTSGLDPGTEGQITDVLRGLCQSGVTVMFTTHATATIESCDKVVVLARGGHLAFVGTPARALAYFDVPGFAELYRRLNTGGSPEQWGERWRRSADYRQVLAEQHAVPEEGAGLEGLPPTPKGSGLRRQWRQFRVLSRRNLELHMSSPSHLVPFMLQPLILSLLLLALFPSGVFKPSVENPTAALQLIYAITLSAFVFGLLFGIQEIVKEFRIFRRERMVGLGVWPYLLSKVMFLWPLLVVLLAVMMVVLRLFDRLPADFETDLRLFLTLALTSLAGLAGALLSSSWARTPPQASQTLGLWIFPQTLFAGALFAVPAMNLAGRWISALTAVRWSFEGAGRVVHLNRLFKFHPTPIGRSLHVQYHSSFFANEAGPYVLLCVFIVVPLVLSARVLKKRTAVEANEGPPRRGGPGGPPGGPPRGGPPG